MFKRKIITRSDYSRESTSVNEKWKKNFQIFKIHYFFSKTFKKIGKNSMSFLKVLEIMSGICRTFYYILDNILWGINIGALSEIFTG